MLALYSTFVAVIIFCLFRLYLAMSKLNPDQITRVLSIQPSRSRFFIYIGMALLSALFIQYGGLPFWVSITAIFALFVLAGVWSRVGYVLELKRKRLPRAYLLAVTIYSSIILLAMLIIFGITIPYFIPTKTMATYACPGTNEVQDAVQFMTPSDSKLWSDTQALPWNISIPPEVNSPIIIKGFTGVRWNEKSRKVMCVYAAPGGRASIFVYGTFIVSTPVAPIWKASQSQALDCRSDAKQCQFNVENES